MTGTTAPSVVKTRNYFWMYLVWESASAKDSTFPGRKTPVVTKVSFCFNLNIHTTFPIIFFSTCNAKNSVGCSLCTWALCRGRHLVSISWRLREVYSQPVYARADFLPIRYSTDSNFWQRVKILHSKNSSCSNMKIKWNKIQDLIWGSRWRYFVNGK